MFNSEEEMIALTDLVQVDLGPRHLPPYNRWRERERERERASPYHIKSPAIFHEKQKSKIEQLT